MTRTVKFAGVTVLLAALVILAACGNGTPVGSPKPPASPSTTTFDEAEWKISTPRGWTREVITPDADAKKAIRYKAATGEYFIVAIDPQGSGVGGDAVWRYRVKGSGFEVVDREDCTATDGSCNNTDARYDVAVLWASGATPPKVGGHTWYFLFGNTAKATIDAGAFEAIVESVQVKA